MGVEEESVVMGDSGTPELFDADAVTGNTFQFLGVAPLLGRGIEPSDALPGAPPVFVLSYKKWRKRFGLDAGIVGKTFIMNGKPTTLIGIMPPRFAFWGGDIWMPASLDRNEAGGNRRYLVLYGHLKPGLSAKAAEPDVQILAGRLSKIYRQDYPKQFDVHLESLGHIAAGLVQNTLFTLLAAVGLLLLIACANVANLLLAKATARKQEIVLRMTLGAGRFRVIRQLLVESLLLALAGAATGCVFAWAGLKGLVAMVPIYTFPDEAAIEPNTPVLLATLLIAIVTALIFGLAPAMAASAGGLNEWLKAGGRGNSGFRRGRLRNFLISGEVALSLLLLSGAGLLMRSFLAERQVDIGISTGQVLTTGLSLPPKQYKTTESQARFLRDLLPRVQNLPGVVSAAGAVMLPPSGGPASDFDVAGFTHSERWKGDIVPCSWQFFQTVRLRLLAGRLPTAADEDRKLKIAVINQTMAEKYFGRQDPLGRELDVEALRNAPEPLANPRFQIVGVVSDIKNDGVRRPVVPEAYVPYTLAGYGAYTVYVRTVGNPAALSTALEGQVLTLDRNVVPQETRTLDSALETSTYARPRFGLVLFSVFAGIGLLLVSLGVYSVMSYSVSQQTREIGIRMALGASASDVRSQVVTAGLRFVSMGVGAGMLFVFFVGRVLASQLFGVSWYDPLTLGSVVGVLVVVGLASSYVPSLRATRVDPAVSLRYE
jgi:predicted permease